MKNRKRILKVLVIRRSLGRTDLHKGNYDQLIEGIKTKLLVLDEETQVFSGHGNPTKIGFEKVHNPFLK